MRIIINIDDKIVEFFKKHTSIIKGVKLSLIFILPILSVSLFIGAVNNKKTKDQLSPLPDNFEGGQLIESQVFNERFTNIYTSMINLDNLANNLQATAIELSNTFATAKATVEANTAELEPISLTTTGELFFTGVNVHIRNEGDGGSTDGTPNGNGNLIIGYNENDPLETAPDWWDDLIDCKNFPTLTPSPSFPPTYEKDGSHNLIVGQGHEYKGFGSAILGFRNMITGNYSTIVGGVWNVVNGNFSTISGQIEDPNVFGYSLVPCTLDKDHGFGVCTSADSDYYTACALDVGENEFLYYDIFCTEAPF